MIFMEKLELASGERVDGTRLSILHRTSEKIESSITNSFAKLNRSSEKKMDGAESRTSLRDRFKTFFKIAGIGTGIGAACGAIGGAIYSEFFFVLPSFPPMAPSVLAFAFIGAEVGAIMGITAGVIIGAIYAATS